MAGFLKTACTVAALLLMPSAAIAASTIAADAAYKAQDYATCARLYGELADTSPASPNAGYNAACCLALAGQPAAAFKRLETSIASAFVSVSRLENDQDLVSLHAAPQWHGLISLARQQEDVHLKGVDRPLRQQLLERMGRDQDIREQLARDESNRQLIEQSIATDHDNTQWLKALVAQRGWPGKSMVYLDGAQAAWLLAQHADDDPAFQQQVVTLLAAAVEKGEATGSQLAYLTDRVRVGRGEKQLYGTQFTQTEAGLVPAPIEDAANVDARRRVIGLGTLAEHTAQMRALYPD